MRSTPIRLIQERRDVIGVKMDIEFTAPTISGDESVCSTAEESLSHDCIDDPIRICRQSSHGSSCAKLPPPRLTSRRESSSDPTGSGARKRSFGRTRRVDRASTTAIAGSNAYNDFLDDELIRQQHEIMGQIKREQEEDFNGTKQQTTSTPGKMMTAKVANEESLWSPTMNTPSSPATRPLPPARTVEPPSEDNYLDQYLDDPTMMLEQQRIMDEILQQQQVTKQDDYVTTTTHKIEHHKKTAVPTSVASIPSSSSRPCSVQMENAPFQFADIQRRPKLSMKSFTSSPTGGQLPSEEDDLVRAYGSQSLRIKGTNHTWKEIEQGQATLVQCPSCSTILQVSRKAKLLYCTKCQEVSPIALYGDNKSTTNDGRIALVLQRQERHVASVRKMAKETNGR